MIKAINAIAAILGITLVVALSWLTPSPAGIGTHMQLIPVPCLFKTLFGIRCPSCGLTTSLAFLLDGDFVASFHAHPLGMAVFAALLALIVVSLMGVVKNWAWWKVVERRWFQWVVMCGMGVYLVVWIVRLSF